MRSRSSPEQFRDRALEAARALILEGDRCQPSLVKVAARLGCRHSNILHHFGSANAFRAALAAHAWRRLNDAFESVVGSRREGSGELGATALAAVSRAASQELRVLLLSGGKPSAGLPFLSALGTLRVASVTGQDGLRRAFAVRDQELLLRATLFGFGLAAFDPNALRSKRFEAADFKSLMGRSALS